jgi:HAMP domain-containing protein
VGLLYLAIRRARPVSIGAARVLFGTVIVFFVTRCMLGHVREITEAASRIGQSDFLSSRVPTSKRNDEVGHLALTLNRMEKWLAKTGFLNSIKSTPKSGESGPFQTWGFGNNVVPK